MPADERGADQFTLWVTSYAKTLLTVVFGSHKTAAGLGRNITLTLAEKLH